MNDREEMQAARAVGKAKQQERRLTALQIADALKRADGHRVGIGHQVHGYDAGCPVCQGSPSGIAEVLLAAGLAQSSETREARAIRRQVAEEIAQAIEAVRIERKWNIVAMAAAGECATLAREIGSKETS